jgi:uncharacterized repeat protein (TIGR01451 family)
MKIVRGLALALIPILLTIGLLTVLRAEAGPAAPAGALVTLSQTTVADFNQGNFYLSGMTRNDDGEVTLLQLGIAGEWLTATNSTGLVPRFEHASISYNNRLYVFGGRTPSGLRSIQFSTINSTTHNLGNWLTATTSLTTSIYTYTLGGNGVAGLSTVQLGGRVYLLGGHDGTKAYYYKTVSFASLDPTTGQLGPLATTQPLPQGLANGQALVFNGRIYYMGGLYTSSLKSVNTVYYAMPNLATGIITAWYTTTAPLPYKTFGQMAAATVNNRIYAMSGITSTPFNGSVPNVYFAEPTASGNITGWVAAKPLQQSVYGGAAVSFAGQIYDTGGAWGSDISAASNYVVAGLDALDTGVITWTSTSGITPSRLLHTAVVNSDGWLYIVGGSNGASQPIQQNVINIAATTGQIGSAYAPNGNFLAQPFDFGANNILHSLSWVTTLPLSTSASLRYRTALNGGAYTAWSALSPAISGTKMLTLTSVGRYLQYQVFFTASTDLLASPALDQVNVTAEVPTPPTFRKSANPASGSSVEANDRITYTLTYSNVGDNAISDVVIFDPVPTTTTYLTGSIFGPSGVTSDTSDISQLSWTIGTLPSHTGGTIGFVVTVNSDAPEGSVIYNSADFNSDLANLSSNATYHTLGLPPELVKSHISSAPAVAQGQVQPGDVITYTLTYTNPNTQPLLNTAMMDSLPLGITYLGSTGPITPTVSLDSGHQVLQWSIGTVPALDHSSVGFYAQVVTDTTIVPNGGSIDNEVSGIAGERQFSSNTDSVPVRYRFDLMLSKSDGVANVTEGSVVVYTIQITNVTSVPITPTGIVITESLQPGIPTGQLGVLQCVAPCTGWAFVGSGGDGSLMYTRTIPFLGPNETTILTLTAQVSPTLLSDAPDVLAVANQVSAIDDGQQGIEVDLINQTAVDTDTIGLPPELVKSHISSAPVQALGQVQPGDIVTYTLTYSNPSLSQSALNAIITDSLPFGITYLSSVGSPAPVVSLEGGHQVLQWSVGTILAQAQGAVGFVAQVVTDTTLAPNGGSIDNAAFATASEWQFSSNTDSVPVRYRFDLMVSKDDGVISAAQGTILNYTIRITNVTNLPITPTGIIVTDVLQSGIPTNQPGVLQCVAPCAGWTFDSVSGDGSLVYSRLIPSLGPNQSIVVTLAAQISSTLWADAPDVLAVANQVSAFDDGQQGIEINLINQTAVDTDVVSGPDIVVTDLHATSSVLIPGKLAHFVVTLFNSGFFATQNSDSSGWFGVDLYVKPVGSPPPTGPDDRYLGFCGDSSNDPCTWQLDHYWVAEYPNSSLAAGATISHTYDLSITLAGTYWLYVQADPYWAGSVAPYSAGTPAHGRIVEGNETNNIYGPIVIRVDYVKVYLPIVMKLH